MLDLNSKRITIYVTNPNKKVVAYGAAAKDNTGKILVNMDN